MPSLRKVPGSPFWIACFRDSAGKQFNRSTKKRDKKSAVLVAAEFERMARGWLAENPTVSAIASLRADLLERIGEPLEVHTVREEFSGYLAGLESKSESTRERYKQIVTAFLSSLGPAADKKLGALAARDVLAFRDARLAAGLAPTSADFELKQIRSVLKRAMLAGRIQKNVAAEVPSLNRKGAVRSVFEPAQVLALLAACAAFHKRGQLVGKDWRGVVLIAFYTGARLSDVVNLRWHNVDFENKCLRYTEKKKRFATEIQVPWHPDLEAYLLARPSADDPQTLLFPMLAGRSTGGANGLSREFVALMGAAGIERRVIGGGTAEGKKDKASKGRKIYDLGEHSFRHSFNSHLARAGVAEDVRQRLCGHESKEVSRRYTHHELEGLRAAVGKLPGLPRVPALSATEDEKPSQAPKARGRKRAA